jgi:hypothetical protein
VGGRLLQSAHDLGAVAGWSATATGAALRIIRARLPGLEPAHEDGVATLDRLAGGTAALERRGVDVDARASSGSVVDQVGMISVPIDARSHPGFDLGVAIRKIVRKARPCTAGPDVVAKGIRESAREVIDGDRRSFSGTAACGDEREGCAEAES